MSGASASAKPSALRRQVATIVVAAMFLALLVYTWSAGTRLDPVAKFERPDHHYAVIVLRKHGLWPGRPGQSGDAPGVVRLVDRSGQVLNETPVEMVQLVENVDWQERRVVIKLVADWPLPD